MLMDTPDKIRSDHIRRTAYLYVRQSTLRQVVEHQESTQRQYALRKRAFDLGWSTEQLTVIDSDLGESGSSTQGREGFRKLVAEVGLGRAGIVMGLEVSRLARNSADWHRLIELCALTDTLILDEDGVYDPGHFNDRLLLGLKGTMSEAELHILRARLRGGLLNKARRGELRLPLPVGFAYDDQEHVVLDPDQQVQQSVRHLFTTFRQTGSAHRTAVAFRDQGLAFPRRRQGGPNHGELDFIPLPSSTVVRILHNPRYAGAYAFGKTHSRRTVDGRVLVDKLPRDEWIALFPDAHEGYITWDEYEDNQRLLKNNRACRDRSGPTREGCALLQGLAFCGVCGQRFHVQYKGGHGTRRTPTYTCASNRDLTRMSACQTIVGGKIDAAVGELVLDTMTPASVELAMEVQRELQARVDEVDHLRRQAVERAQYDAELARRRFMEVDPGHRLVANTLEADWDDKLCKLQRAQQEYERQVRQDRQVLAPDTRKRLIALTRDFQCLWNDSETPDRERKRMLALLIEDVTLLKVEGAVKVHVCFKGGRTETRAVDQPANGGKAMKTRPEVIAEIDRLLDDYTPDVIADHLNQLGFKPGGAKRFGTSHFTGTNVARLSKRYGLVSRYNRLRSRGLLTAHEMMRRLGIGYASLQKRVRMGRVAQHPVDGRTRLYGTPDTLDDRPAEVAQSESDKKGAV